MEKAVDFLNEQLLCFALQNCCIMYLSQMPKKKKTPILSQHPPFIRLILLKICEFTKRPNLGKPRYLTIRSKFSKSYDRNTLKLGKDL